MSESLLSQSDTALLLGELADAVPGSPFTDAAQVKPFTFGDERSRPAERLTGLERMGEKLARALKPAIEPFARARLQITPEPIETLAYDAWQDTLPGFVSLSHYRLRPLKGGMLIAIPPDLVAGLVESYYGGGDPPRAHRATEFSGSEELLLKRVLERIVTLLTEAWREVAPIEPALVQRETSAQHIGFARGDEAMAVQRFAIEGACRATIAIVYPLAMLRPIEERMASKVHDEDAQTSNVWRQRLRDALSEVSLPVRSILARPEISVARLMALQPGDVIPITLAQRTPLHAGTHRIAEGMIGEQDGRAALMIERVGRAA